MIEFGLIVIAASIVLIFLRVPVGVAMFTVGAAGLAYVLGLTTFFNWLKGLAYTRLASFDLIVIPMFLMMGQFASHGGLSRLLFNFVNAFIGHYRGGIAMATVGACGCFGAICGSSVATAATIGQVALPEMRKAGYSGKLATGAVAAGGTLGILIPPSIPLVVYSILTGESIGKLFVAAIVPATIAFVGYLVAVRFQVTRDPDAGPAGRVHSWRERAWACVKVSPIAGVFAIVVIGIYGGWASPTEASAIGAVTCGLLAWCNGMRMRGFIGSMLGTAKLSAMIYLILLGADMLNAALALTNMTNWITDWIVTNEFSPMVVLTIILLIYILLGCVMESMSMIMLTIPLFYPVIMALDFWGLPAQDKSVWFGVLALMVVEIGLITPPIGINVFVVNRLAPQVSLSQTFRGVMPFLVSDIVRVVLVVMIPSIALALLHL